MHKTNARKEGLNRGRWPAKITEAWEENAFGRTLAKAEDVGI